MGLLDSLKTGYRTVAKAPAGKILAGGAATGGAALAVGAGAGYGLRLFGENAGAGAGEAVAEVSAGLESAAKSLLVPALIVAAAVVGWQFVPRRNATRKGSKA